LPSSASPSTWVWGSMVWVSTTVSVCSSITTVGASVGFGTDFSSVDSEVAVVSTVVSTMGSTMVSTVGISGGGYDGGFVGLELDDVVGGSVSMSSVSSSLLSSLSLFSLTRTFLGTRGSESSARRFLGLIAGVFVLSTFFVGFERTLPVRSILDVLVGRSVSSNSSDVFRLGFRREPVGLDDFVGPSVAF